MPPRGTPGRRSRPATSTRTRGSPCARTRSSGPTVSPGIYGVVHFAHRAVGVLPVDEHGRIWLVGQYRYPIRRYSWEIPEGGSHAGESPEEAARRELREETGLLAGHMEQLAVAHLSNSVSDEEAVIFRATDLLPGPSAPEGCERIEVRLAEWIDVWEMLGRGEITDSMTVIALLHEAVRRGATPRGG